MAPKRKRLHRPIVVEVAYRHESFVKLLHEGCHLLCPQSDILYAFLLFIQENEQKNAVKSLRLVVLERAEPLASDMGSPPISKWLASPWPLDTPANSISTGELSNLPARVILDLTVTRHGLRSISQEYFI